MQKCTEICIEEEGDGAQFSKVNWIMSSPKHSGVSPPTSNSKSSGNVEASSSQSAIVELKSLSRWPLFAPRQLMKSIERFTMEEAVAVLNANDDGLVQLPHS
jgi:hypothetical protein